MAIPIIDSLKINTNLPLDGRTIASSSNDRDAIEYKYDGLKVFALDNRITYTWNLASYNSTGITSSSWDIGEPGIGTVTGTGSFNYIPKWDNTGYGLTSTSIISVPISVYESNQKVGIGGTPSEAFQINGNYLSSAIGATSLPFVIHKGSSTVIGENWYYNITSQQDQTFNSTFGSSTITFNNGGFVFKGRYAGSSNTMNDLLDISPAGVVNFNNYLSMTASSTLPSYTNGSLYVDSNTDRWKVMENSQSRFISRPYEVYTAILSQSSTVAPTQVILESTIGSGSWSYLGTGTYNLVISGGFSGSCPAISGFCGPYTSTNIYFGSKIDNNTYQIRTISSAGSGTYSGISLDNCLNNTFIDIKVF